jgi:hypothetical protein
VKKTHHRRTLGLALLAVVLASAGCGTTAEFVATDDPREPLKKGFYTTYTFRYKARATGLLGSLFGGSTLDEPRLLYAEGGADFETNPEAFRDTGAPFDEKKGEITWRIPNIRVLSGKTLTFVIDANNLKDRPVLPITFPPRGKIHSVEPTTLGRKVRFTVAHSETVYNIRFFARLGRGRRPEIRPEEEKSPSESIRNFLWDPVKDLDPDESDLPLTFEVEYENWYYEKEPAPYITSAVRIPRAIVFAPYTYVSDRTVRIPFRLWGKVGLMTFDWRAGEAGEWKVAKGLKLTETDRGDRVAVWDLHVEGLAPLTGPVELRARALGRELGLCRVLPPKPAIRILSHRQEGNLVTLLFDASYIAPSEIRLFAGFGKDQRLVRAEEIVKRSAGMITFRVDRLPPPKEAGPEDLFIFLSAENAAGSAGTELHVPLIGLGVQSVQQAQGDVEIRVLPPRNAGPISLEYRPRGSEAWTSARELTRTGETLRWAFLRELGGKLPKQIEIRLRAARGESYGETATRIAPLHAALGKLEPRGGGVFDIPVTVQGVPDWVHFEFDLGGRGFRPARAAVWDRERRRLRWDFWGDVSRESHAGESAVLRATFLNPWGSYTARIEGIQPLFLSLGTPATKEGIVRIPFRLRQGTEVRVFLSTDGGRTFQPMKNARVAGEEIVFDVKGLGPLTGAALRVRVSAMGPAGEREEADVTVRLSAGIEPARAYWHQGLLWVRYEVDWHVSEKDVRAEFSVEGPEARPPIWEEASIPIWKVYDVTRRGFAWDVARDMARTGVLEPNRFHLRLVIQEKDAGPIVREVGLGDLPTAPILLPNATMGLERGDLTFSVGKMKLPPDAPPFSLKRYNVRLSFLDPATTHFKIARLSRRIRTDNVLAWARDQALPAVRKGTWVKVTVTLKGNNRVTGFALFDVRLTEDHPFFTYQKDEGF